MPVIRPFESLPTQKREEINKAFVPHLCLPGLFSDIETSLIKKLWNGDKTKEGKIGNQSLNQEIRKSKIQFLETEDNEWIYDKIAMACILVNSSRYKFDITGFQSKLLLAQYERGEFYEWHMDTGRDTISNRKLSITIQLSGAEEYEGGELQFMNGGTPVNAPKEKGTAIIFPSFVSHRVQPVLSGCRRSLVGWIAGPPFR